MIWNSLYDLVSVTEPGNRSHEAPLICQESAVWKKYIDVKTFFTLHFTRFVINLTQWCVDSCMAQNASPPDNSGRSYDQLSPHLLFSPSFWPYSFLPTTRPCKDIWVETPRVWWLLLWCVVWSLPAQTAYRLDYLCGQYTQVSRGNGLNRFLKWFLNNINVL